MARQAEADNTSRLRALLDHPWFQLALGFSTIAGFLVGVGALAMSESVRNWVATAYRGYGWIAILVLVALVVVLLVAKRSHGGSVPNETPQDTSASGPSRQLATEVIRDAVPGGDALEGFLGSTLFAGDRLQRLRGCDTSHYLSDYEKSFKVSGADISTCERYTIQNQSRKPTVALTLASFGGASLRREELAAQAFQRIADDDRRALRLAVDAESDRFKILRAHFASSLPPGGSTVIEYMEDWPRAMMYGIDAVFYTQVLYYSRGIGRLTSTLEFDHEPTAIHSWWYDLDSRTCEPDENPVVSCTPSTGLAAAYKWSVASPRSSRLYFVAFDRPMPSG